MPGTSGRTEESVWTLTGKVLSGRGKDERVLPDPPSSPARLGPPTPVRTSRGPSKWKHTVSTPAHLRGTAALPDTVGTLGGTVL